MSGAAFLRLKKLKQGGIIATAARHNRRVIQAEMGAAGSIDPARSHLNQTLAGPPSADDVAALARQLMKAAGIDKMRRNGVLGIEVVFSLPVAHNVDEGAFFRDCVRWAGDAFGGAQNILSADIHRDESAPHCHVLMLPLVNGRMVGSDLVGNRTKLLATYDNFHQAVASRHGLRKAPARLQGTAKTETATQVLKCLRDGSDGALSSRLWAQVREDIERDPGRYALALGITPGRPQKRRRTMTQIFTSKGHGRRHETNPIGFAVPPNPPSLCSVGFSPLSATPRSQQPAPEPIRSGAAVISPAQFDFVRVREDEIDAALYDPNSGEFKSDLATGEF